MRAAEIFLELRNRTYCISISDEARQPYCDMRPWLFFIKTQSGGKAGPSMCIFQATAALPTAPCLTCVHSQDHIDYTEDYCGSDDGDTGRCLAATCACLAGIFEGTYQFGRDHKGI